MARKQVPYIGLKPDTITKEAWALIVEAWENGLSDREAAFRASRFSNDHIKESDIKQWIHENPDIGDLRDYLHNEILSTAKLNIVKEIREGKSSTTKWYLERKAADEFSTKAALAFEKAAVELSLEEKERQMREFMKQFGGENVK